jgi:two-component system cell cycle sensor histidine kinase/response regulator CckA
VINFSAVSTRLAKQRKNQMQMKKKILVADDDRVVLKYLKNLLVRDGHEVATAEDGFSVLNLLDEFTPDIMFLDLIMPRIDGCKMIQIVRNMPKFKDCYLVIVSAAMAEIDFNLMEIGADAYIAKGSLSSMAEHIREAIVASDSPGGKEEPKPIHGLESVYARQMTKELLSRNRHLETVLESMAEGILEVYSGKIIYANSVAVSLLGLPLAEILAAYPPDLFDDNIGPRLHEILQNNTGSPAEIGQKIPLELKDRLISIKVLPVKDEPSTIIIMMTDVTDHKKLELQLQHKQRMEAIGTIAAGVAHNFRNTLTEILVNSQLIQMNFKAQGGLHGVAGRINASVKKGVHLVEGLLQFSRKQIKEEFRLINLTEVISGIYEIIRKSFDQKIEIQTFLPNELPIIGDPISLGQAFMNLCNNARDAMPDGGRLTISARQEGSHVLVKVSDTGQGMDREAVAKCFDPFYTSKPLGKGTGLGLSTTYGIIKSHDGLIIVDSQPERGTTFKIHFPLASKEEASKPEWEPRTISGRGELILIVDDEPEIRYTMQGLLKHLGYQTEFASTGKEGLEKYRRKTPDAVLMDINMPEMDGVRCIEEILKFDPHANISIFSGYHQDIVDELSPMVKEVIKDFIPKPIRLETLSTLLAKMLKRDGN